VNRAPFSGYAERTNLVLVLESCSFSPSSSCSGFVFRERGRVRRPDLDIKGGGPLRSSQRDWFGFGS
jgi:hypothetical protein